MTELTIPVFIRVGEEEFDLGSLGLASDFTLNEQLSGILHETADVLLEEEDYEVEAPEGHFFKGHYTPAFGLINVSLYRERKWFWGKRVAGSYVVEDDYLNGVVAVNAAKRQTLEKWIDKLTSPERTREIRKSL